MYNNGISKNKASYILLLLPEKNKSDAGNAMVFNLIL